MRIEAKKTLRDGFMLSEQELRRLVNVLKQQIEKTSDEQNYIDTYQIKFRNGVVAEDITLDQVLSQENLGSSAIVRLRIMIQDSKSDPNYAIVTEFININEEGEEGTISMRYLVTGEDRDWVFITSSELEERLGRIKKFTISRLMESRFADSSITMIFLFFFVAIFFIQTLRTDYSYIDQIENAWKSGEISDPIEVIIAFERSAKNVRGEFGDIFKYLGLTILVFLAIYGLILGTLYFFPPYNFYWGDYMKYFDRKQAQGRFIYITILLLAIVIPIAVSLFSRIIERSIGF